MIFAPVYVSIGFAVIVVGLTVECVKGRAEVITEIMVDLILDSFVETLQKAVNAFGVSVDNATELHLGE